MTFVLAPVPGELVPNFPPTFARFAFDTDRRNGRSAIPTERFGQEQPKQVQDIGERRHHELLKAIKSIKGEEKEPEDALIVDALNEQRDWRN